VGPSFGTSCSGCPPWWEGSLNDRRKIPDNCPFLCLTCCHNLFSGLFKFHNLCSSEVPVQENLVGKRKKLMLSSKGMESIRYNLKLEEESRDVAHPDFVQSYIGEAKGVPKEPRPHFHRIRRVVDYGDTSHLEIQLSFPSIAFFHKFCLHHLLNCCKRGGSFILPSNHLYPRIDVCLSFLFEGGFFRLDFFVFAFKVNNFYMQYTIWRMENFLLFSFI